MNRKRIYIEINNTCNMTCRFCPYHLTNTNNEYMDYDKIIKILSDIKKNVPYRIVYFHNLNEPFLHPKIDEIMQYCDNNNIKYGITTNGILLDKHIESISKSKMQELNISYQVIDEIENFHRNNKMNVCEYRGHIVDNVKRIMKNFAGDIKIKLLITDRTSIFNGKKIKGIEKKDELIDEINKFYTLFLDRELSEEQKGKLKQLDITRFCKINLFKNIYIELFPFLTWGNYYDKVHSAHYGKCDGVIGQIQVKVNGDVLPCCYDINSDLKIGNVFDKPLSQILMSDECKYIMNHLISNKVELQRCKKCLGKKYLFDLICGEYKFLFKSKIEERFIYSENKIIL